MPFEWINGPTPTEPIIDWNAKFLTELKGELSEEVARRTLGKFIMHNVGFAVRILTGFKLTSYQRLIIKGWLSKNYSMTIAGRGFSKSFLWSHFCYLYCLMNPGRRIVMVAPTFRSCRKILENIDEWSRRRSRPGDPGGALLRQTFLKDMTKKQDVYMIEFSNGSSIVGLPMGDPDRLRSYRCTVLGVDEGLMVPQTVIDNVLKPFLFTPPPEEIMRRQRVREKEDELIKAGTMKEEDRTEFDSLSKMVILSSASYAWQDLFELFKKYLKIIRSQDPQTMAEMGDDKVEAEKLDGKSATYLVHQLPYQLADPDFVDKAAKDEIESGMYSESTVKREFEAQFVQDSDGYFRAAKMVLCTVPDGEEPCVEIVGDSRSKYVLAIDQNVSDAETADHFAMCVIKIVDKKNADGNIEQIGLVVHQYAEVAVPLKEHIAYLYYLLTYFNIVYIGYDASQGKNLGFISICNESELFRDKKVLLKHITADFGKDNYDEIVKQVQKGYNKENRTIVQPQAFHSEFQRAANMHLQACFDAKNILFASKARANGSVFTGMMAQDVGPIIRQHSSFRNPDAIDGPALKDEFIIQQDTLIDLVKKECALIEIKNTSLGNISYDIPQHMKRGNKKRNRIRKDSYSALVLGTWCLRIYLDMSKLPVEEDDSGAAPVLV